MPYNTLIHTKELPLTDKEKFIQDWLINNPEDDETDALEAWKQEVKFLNTFQDWDNQLDWNDD